VKTYLGIDGGGTKTKLILCDGDGRVLAEDVQPTSNYLQVGVGGVTRVLAAGLDAICKEAGVDAAGIAGAFVGLPGFGDSEAEIPRLQAAVDAAMAGIPCRVGNDCENSLAGTLGGRSGISLICGTGSIACGRNDAGETLRCGGWHHLLGSDEGSGYWISVQLLHAFTRQSDGRDARTPLYRAIREALALQVDGDVITRVVEEWGMDRTRVAALSRLAGDLVRQGDPATVEILRRAAGELADMAATLYRRLGFTGVMPVSYSGGVFSLGAPLLDPLRALLAKHSMALESPLLPPDRGALVLAFQGAGEAVPEGLLHPVSSE